MKKITIVLLACVMWVLPAWSQQDPEVGTDLLAADITAIEAIALYPESVRRTIMEAAAYPDALLRMEEIQQKSEARFQAIIAPFQREVQEDFYELARYPALVQSLSINGRLSKSEIREVLNPYPGEIHEQALDLGRKRYSELGEIDALNRSTERAFQQLLAEYPAEIRESLAELVSMPEVLDLLLQNFRSTVMLGSMYQRNPEWIWHITDSIQLVVAQKKTEELNDWKAELEADPEAMKEFQEAAEDFVRENGYQTRSYTVSPDYYTPYWLSRNHVPYVYWYGYPFWYDQPFWYPHAYWYHWGFYYGPDHGLVIFDFPSWYFMDWYFVWAHHHYYYPHLTNTYLRYHTHHRHSTTAATRVIGEWESANRSQYTRDWLREDPDRVSRIRSYGARETQRQRTVYDVPTVRNETRNRPVYTSPSRNPQAPDRVIRQAPTRPEVVRPVPNRPPPTIRTNPVKPLPQVNQAARYHQEKLVKRKPQN